jgi:hypothetical protein
MKGKHPDDEIAALPAWAEVFHVEPSGARPGCRALPGVDAADVFHVKPTGRDRIRPGSKVP